MDLMTIALAAQEFTAIDDIAIKATCLLVIFLILFGLWGWNNGRRP